MTICRKVGSKRWQVILSLRSYLRLLLSDLGPVRARVCILFTVYTGDGARRWRSRSTLLTDERMLCMRGRGMYDINVIIVDVSPLRAYLS